MSEFKVGEFTSITKRIEIDGPIRLFIDNDDVDTEYVKELVPEILKALNSIPMIMAVKQAEEHQRERFSKNDDE